MSSKGGKRAAIYARVSTDDQVIDNQVRELRQVAERRGWDVVEVYADEGISGAKGRNKRPGLDRLLNDASRRKFDVVMAWAIDRLGRSLIDLLGSIQHLEHAGVDLYLDEQNIDTTNPMGKLLFQVTGAFAEFERTIIRDRIKVGMKRIKEKLEKEPDPEKRKFVSRRSGKIRRSLGRPGPSDDKLNDARAMLATGAGIIKTAKDIGLGVGTVHKLKRAMAGRMAEREGCGRHGLPGQGHQHESRKPFCTR
jgi:DNA invertase Pin-like site-specific DNA recombinase